VAGHQFLAQNNRGVWHRIEKNGEQFWGRPGLSCQCCWWWWHQQNIAYSCLQ
jgi:hypothetical protein